MNYMVFTDSDLDGVASYITFKWFHPTAKINVVNTTVTKFREDYTKWLSLNNTEDYDTIYVLDLDVGEHKDLIDTPKHFVIDHHKTHVAALPYERAKAVVKEYTSACKLVYKTFSTLYEQSDISDAQKKLVLLTDDYDSYTLQLPDSKRLNTVYWATQDRFKSFSKSFFNGFKGFTLQQLNMIKIYNQEITKLEKSLHVFKHTADVGNESINIFGAICDKHINDCADILLSKYKADLAMVVNPKTKHVSFRANQNINFDLIKLVKTLCDDQGGGHAYAAGGPLTESIMAFFKSFKPHGNI